LSGRRVNVVHFMTRFLNRSLENKRAITAPHGSGPHMICLHKLKGEPFWINPDQIGFIEGARESVVTMLDGHHIVASETPEEIAVAVRQHRAQVRALAKRLLLEGFGTGTEPPVVATASSGRLLRALPDTEH
jgi:uncharacterized protein YlzI (FlbEa/FlbD family)